MTLIFTGRVADAQAMERAGLVVLDTARGNVKYWQEKRDVLRARGERWRLFGAVFAPTWEMVNRLKAGTLNRVGYKEQYRRRMLESYERYWFAWEWVLLQDEIGLLCFCEAGAFCHRRLLADFFVSVGERRGIEVEDGGEWYPPTPQVIEQMVLEMV